MHHATPVASAASQEHKPADAAHEEPQAHTEAAAAASGDAAHAEDAHSEAPKPKGISFGVRMPAIPIVPGADAKQKLTSPAGKPVPATPPKSVGGALDETVKKCEVCGCERFQKNPFKLGQCNNCFHKH